jgi:hypothetical protein
MRVPAAEAVPLGRRMSWQKIDNAFGGEVVSFARGLLSASGVVRGSARHKEREDHPLPWRGTVGVLLCEFSRSRAMLAGEPDQCRSQGLISVSRFYLRKEKSFTGATTKHDRSIVYHSENRVSMETCQSMS